MVQGQYTVQDVEASKAAGRDSSYKSCVITMLIFVLLCVILILVAWRLKPASGKRDPLGDSWEHEHFERSRYTNENIPPTTTTTAIPYRTVRPNRKIARTTTGKLFERIQAIPTTSTSTTTTTTTTEKYTTVAIPRSTQAPFTTQGFKAQDTTLPPASTDDEYVIEFAVETESSNSTSTPTYGESSTEKYDTTLDVTNHQLNSTTTDFSSTEKIEDTYTTLSTVSTEKGTTEKVPNVSVLDDTSGAVTDVTSGTTPEVDLFSGTTPQIITADGTSVATSTEDGLLISASSQEYTSTSEISVSAAVAHSSELVPTTTSPYSSSRMTPSLENTPTSTTAKIEVTTPSISSTQTHATDSGETTPISTEGSTTPKNEVPVSTTPIDYTNVNGVCLTSECKMLASRTLSLMNHTMDPCDNYYEYACGGLRNNRVLLQDHPEYDVWNRIADAVKEINNSSDPIYTRYRHFYDQCVEYENVINKSVRIEHAKNILSEVGKLYNSIEWETESKNFDLTTLLVKLFKLDRAPLFDVQLGVNANGPSKFQLKLTVPNFQSKLQLESPITAHCKDEIFADDPHKINMRDIYQNKYLACTRNITKYVRNVEEAIKELNLYENLDPYNSTKYTTDINFFIEFEIFRYQEEIVGWQARDDIVNLKFNVKTIAELESSYPVVDWVNLFSSLLNDDIDKSTEVQIYFEEEYFDKILTDFYKLSSNDSMKFTANNALIAMLAHDLYVDLVKPQPCNREEYCLKTASRLMEDVSSSLYLSTFTAEELSEKHHDVVVLFDQLKDTLNEKLRQAEWLDDGSRSSLVSKLHKMTVIADGGTAFYNDVSYLKNQLNSNDLRTTNNFIENAMQLTKRFRNQLYYLYAYEQTPNATDVVWSFFLLPYDIHPLAVYELNTVIIPFGMLGSWRNMKNLPGFIFRARIGNAIARQIAHHFDSTGLNFGSEGRNNDLVTEEAKEYFKDYEECLYSYDGYIKSWTNQHKQNYDYQFSAKRTRNENIIDNSALRLTYRLYNKSAERESVLPWLNMDHDKLYFLLVAQEFCSKADLLDYVVLMHETEQMPPFLRIDNMMQQSKDFSSVYDCPAGGKQNPPFKCSPFPEVYADPNGETQSTALS